MHSSAVLLTWVLAAITNAAPADVARGTPLTITTSTTTSCALGRPPGWHGFCGVGPVSTNIPAAVSTGKSHAFDSVVTTTTTLVMLVPTMVPAPVLGTVAPIHLPQNILANPEENIGIPTCKDSNSTLTYTFELGNFANSDSAMHMMEITTWPNTTETNAANPFVAGRVLSTAVWQEERGTWAVRVEISRFRAVGTLSGITAHVWEEGTLARMIKKVQGKYPLITKELMEGGSSCYAPELMEWAGGGKRE